jgi:hypothetical protein
VRTFVGLEAGAGTQANKSHTPPWSNVMILHTVEVAPLPGARLAVRFNNGESGVVDLSSELSGEMFAPLRGPELFASAFQHPVMRTVAWANGADFAPEFLLELLHEQEKQAA